MSDPSPNPVRILTYQLDEAGLRRLDNRRRNQLFGCMHAHNELTYLNRLLLFVQNATADGELHDHARSIQMWATLQILAGKLFETWAMIDERILRRQPADPLIGALCDHHGKSLTWLRDYFGERRYKNSAIRIVRDKTAFHYDGLNLEQTIDNLGAGENVVHLAEHPANTLYYLGSSGVFRAIFTTIADHATPPENRSFDERLSDGFRIVVEDVKAANWHEHLVLYGFIKTMMEEAFGDQLEAEAAVTTIPNPPSPEIVGLPSWVDMHGMKS